MVIPSIFLKFAAKKWSEMSGLISKRRKKKIAVKVLSVNCKSQTHVLVHDLVQGCFYILFLALFI